MIHHIKRATRHLIFGSLIVVALSLTTLRVLLLSVDHYKADLSARVTGLVGTPLTIGKLSANMRGYKPEFILTDIKISSVVANAPPAIQLKEIRLDINLLDLLFNREVLSSARISLVGAKLSVTRKLDGSISIVGLKEGDEQPLWLLEDAQYEVLASEVTWLDQKTNAKPIQLEAVNLAIINSGSHHQVNIMTQLPETYGEYLTAVINFEGNAFTSPMNGQVFIDGKNLNLSALTLMDLPISVKINSGKANVKAWGDLQQSQLVTLQTQVDILQLKVESVDDELFIAKQLTAEFNGRLQDNHWQFDVARFFLETSTPKGESKVWPDAVFSLSGILNDATQLQQLSAYIKQLDLKELAYIAQYFAPLSKQQMQLLQQANVQGRLENLVLISDLAQKSLAVKGAFHDLSLMPIEGIPGLSNLTGTIKGTETGGQLRLASNNVDFNLPDVFLEPLKITGIKAKIDWSQTATDWSIASDDVRLNLPHFQSLSRLHINLPKAHDLPFMDLQTNFVSDDVSLLTPNYPKKVMKPADVAWFDKAFAAGRVTKGEILYSAKLGAFPSQNADGVFEASLDVEGLTLNYAPDWPLITDIIGKVDIQHRYLTCEISQGKSHDLNISQATVINPEMGRSKILTVTGSLEGEISHVFEFLKASPLDSEVGFIVDAITPEGITPITLDLTLPLAEGILPKVYGKAQFNNASLTVKALDLLVSKIEGDLKFTEHGVYSDTIRARALNKPIKVNIDKADHQQTFLNITGNSSIEDLQHQFDIPGLNLANGSMSYQLKLGLPYENRSSELLLQSDLLGVGLELPKLLAKTKEQKKSLALTFGLGADKFLPIKLNYNQQFKADVQLDLAAHRLYSGGVLLGAGEVHPDTEPGLSIEINETPFNFYDWLALSPQKVDEKSAPLDIRQFKVHSQQALWKATELGAFDLTLKSSRGYWIGDLLSSFATGKVNIPKDMKGDDKLILAMDSVDLSAFKELKSQSESSESAKVEIASKDNVLPNDLPTLSLTSAKTWWHKINLGRMTLETERVDNGILFKQMDLLSAEQQLKISGAWKVIAGVSQTTFQGHLGVPDAGKWLADLDISKDFMETQADIHFSGHWDGAPYQMALKNIQGDVDVNFKSGRLLSVEPGFGRLLGILAMAQWVKRIQLDFSDIYKEGLSFNTIKGHFDLKDGKAITKDLVVDAIPAKISIVGSTDLINKSLDELISVVPKSADALPIAGTIVDKVTGIIGQSLTGKDQEGFFFGYQYLVKGAWGNSQIIPLHKKGGLVQKTWYSLTDFPWNQEHEEQK